MADIIELEVVGKVTGLKPMLSTVSRLERELVRATKALDQNKISQQRYNTIIASTKTQYSALGVSAQRANAQVDKMAMSLKNTQAAEKAAQATRTLAREKDNLSRKYKPLYAATQLYEKGLMEIKRATTLGILSNEEAIKSTMRLKTAFNSATTGMSGGIAQAGRSTNQLGVVAQQTGYQVGDFLVQIQSGANPMMAFGQQATQLVGVLPLLSDQLGVSAGKLMGIAAGLGILIPLATAIAGYFLRLAGEVKESGDALGSFSSSMSDVRSAIEVSRSSVAELGAEFGYIAADIKKIQDAIIQASINEAFRDMADAVSPFSTAVTGAFDRIVTLQQQMAGMDLTIGSTSQQLQQVEMFELLGAEVDGVLESLGLTTYELVKIQGGFNRISAAGVAQDTEAMAAASLEAIAYLNSLSSSSEETSSNIDQAVIYINELLEAAGLTAAAINGSAEGMKVFAEMSERAAEAAADREQAVKSIKEATQNNIDSMQMELDLAQAILEARGDSAKVSKAIADNARAQVVANLENEGILGNNKNTIMAIYDSIVDVENQTNSWAKAMAGVAVQISGIMNALASLGGGLIENVSLRIQSEVLEAGGNLRDAAVANERYLHDMEMANISAAAAIEGTAAALVANTITIPALNAQFEENIRQTDRLTAATDAYRDRIKDAAAAVKAGGAAAKEAAKLLEKLREEIEQLEFDADPILAYNDALAHLNTLLGMENGLSIEAYSKAVDDLNKGLIESHPLVDGVANAFQDFMGRGFKDFSTFVDDILGLFKNMLIEMAMTALRNKILIPMVMGSAGSAAAGSAAGSAAAGAGGGMLGSLGAGVSAFGGGLTSGASVAFNGIMAGGGLGPAAGAVSGGLGMGGAAGVGTAIGAIAVPLLAVAAVFSFFNTKTKELDAGLRITADSTSTLVDEFKKIEESKFWGLSKDVSTDYNTMEDSSPITEAIDAIKDQALGLGAILGLTADNFSSFASQIQISLKGLSEDEANAEIARAFGVIADQFSYAALGHFEETYGGIIREGESALETLNNLANSLQVTNGIFKDLGFTLYDVSVVGAAAARDFADALGGLEALTAKSSAYYERFYSDSERVGAMTDKVREALSDLGVIMPATIADFRALVDQAARMGNMDLVGSLIDLSAPFAGLIDSQNVLLQDSSNTLREAFENEMQATRDKFDAIIDALGEKLTSAQARLDLSKSIATALSDALRSRLFPSAEAERQSVDEASAYLKSLVGQSEITDVDALRDALSIVANPSTDTYKTLEDYRRDFNRTSVVIGSLEKTASKTLEADQAIVRAIEEQIAQAELDAEMEISALQSQLDALLDMGGQLDVVIGLTEAILGFIATLNTLGLGTTSGTGTTTEDAITNIYNTELGRAPDQAGLDFYTGLAGSGTSIDDISNDIANSPEAKIQALYSELLGRTADQAGLDFYRDAISSGTTIDQVRADIASSQEALQSFSGGGYTGNGARAGGLDGQGGFMAMLHPQEDVIDRTRPTPTVSRDRGSEDSMTELRMEISELRSEQRQILMDISKNTKRTADIERKHDVQGTPPVRAA
jgi:hypothetical protein